jgi:hypothetical protein
VRHPVLGGKNEILQGCPKEGRQTNFKRTIIKSAAQFKNRIRVKTPLQLMQNSDQFFNCFQPQIAGMLKKSLTHGFARTTGRQCVRLILFIFPRLLPKTGANRLFVADFPQPYLRVAALVSTKLEPCRLSIRDFVIA